MPVRLEQSEVEGEGDAGTQARPGARPWRPRELDLHPTSHRKTLEDFNMTGFVLKSNLWQLQKIEWGKFECREPREEIAVKMTVALSRAVAVKMGRDWWI